MHLSFKLTQLTQGDIFSGHTTFFNPGTINNTVGTIVNIFGLIVGEGSISTPGSFASISFTAKESIGRSSLHLYDVGVTNETEYIPITVSDGNVTIAAYTLTITIDGSGTVSKNPDQTTYSINDIVQLTASANTGWTFDYWSGNLSGNQNPTTITMNCNKTVIAHFTQNQYTLTITTDGQGSVTKNPDQATYTYNQIVQLTANPTTGWRFDHWSGNLTGTTNPTTLTMNGNKVVTAHFTQDTYTLTINVVGGGTVSKNPDQSTYTYGQVVHVNATANSGWTFDHWSGNLTGNQNPTTITMNGNKIITATFQDSAPPSLQNIILTSSNPYDTNPPFGWMNITCDITDNVAVRTVNLKVHNPDSSWNNVTMMTKSSHHYYYNSSTVFSTSGNYSYFIWANDTSSNFNSSTIHSVSMPPNWDINNDGKCNVLDIVLISNYYSALGTPGWIRQDVDNNGHIQVLDFALVSNHYGETWWT